MRLLTTILLCSFVTCLSAQNKVLNQRNPGLEVKIDEHNQAYYIHQLKKDETLYSLATYFKVSLEDLLLLNNYRKGDIIPLGADIVIPINVEALRTPDRSLSDRWVPLYYTVNSQETLYKISKIYFPQKIENLITRNNVSSFALKRGEKLIVGWWGEAIEREKTDLASRLKDKIKQKLQERKKTNDNSDNQGEVIVNADEDLEMKLDSIISEIVDTDETELTELDSLTTEADTVNINYRLGIASWDKSGFDRKNLFVMHNTAKPNSFIRLRYPVTGKEITAKVVCAIPDNLFAKDIDIVISPAVAIGLGALDSRFQIQMDYYE